MKMVLDYTCQHKCEHCYNPGRTPNLAAPLTVTSTPSTVRQIIAECGRNGVTNMNFTGGEPLLHRDLLYEGLRASHEWNMYCSVNTSLIALNEKDIDVFQEVNIVGLNVSMPHHRAEEFNRITASKNYDRFIDRLNLCKKRDQVVTVNTVVTKNTWQDTYEAGKFLHEEFGLLNFGASPVYPSSVEHVGLMLEPAQVEKVYDMLFQLKEDFGMNTGTFRAVVPCFSETPEKYIEFTRGCGMVRTELTLLANGEVKACDAFPMKYGNMLERPLDEVLDSTDPFLPYEDGTLFKAFPSECEPCSEKLHCRGGCRIEALVVNGSVDAPNPYFRQPLEAGLFPEYVELPDWTVGLLQVAIPEQQTGQLENGIPIYEGCGRDLFSPEELALLHLLQLEKRKNHPVDANMFRIQNRLRDDLLRAFLSKLSDNALIDRP